MTDVVAAARVMNAGSLERSLLEAVVRTGDDRVPVLGRHEDLPPDRRLVAVAAEARSEALPVEEAEEIDADAVAAWITGHYPAGDYPAVVLGSPHGSAVHLAAAIGAAWLPTTVTVTVPWPDGSVGDWLGAREHGAGIAKRLTEANPGIVVRQVHDPVGSGPVCGAVVEFRLRWRRLPPAYLSFLAGRVRRGGTVIFLRDLRTWPVEEIGPSIGFQVGSPVSGWTASCYEPEYVPLRDLLAGLGELSWPRPWPALNPHYAETSGDPALGHQVREFADATGLRAYRILYTGPEVLSASVADLFHELLPDGECVIETGRLLDPYRAGFVPYWCESSSRRAVSAAEWWLAGSDRFDAVTVLPEPPGVSCDAYADLSSWRSLAGFGRHRREIDRRAVVRYPMFPYASGLVNRMISPPREGPGPLSSLTAAAAIRGLRRLGTARGLLVG